MSARATRPSKRDRAEALAAVEGSFAGFAGRALPRLRRQVAAEAGAGLDVSGYPVLALIDACGPLRTTELAERIGLDTSTVSRKIADLEESGLLARASDPDDRRAHLLKITRRGRLLLARTRAVRAALLEEALRGWSDAEIDRLAHCLSRLASALADLPQP